MDRDDGYLPNTYEGGGPARLFGWRWLPSPANHGAAPCLAASALERPVFRSAAKLEKPSRTLPLLPASWSSDSPWRFLHPTRINLANYIFPSGVVHLLLCAVLSSLKSRMLRIRTGGDVWPL